MNRIALRELAYLFQPGRNHHGGLFTTKGNIINEIERNLSLFTDNELREFIHGANFFKELVAAEIDSREVKPDRDHARGTKKRYEERPFFHD